MAGDPIQYWRLQHGWFVCHQDRIMDTPMTQSFRTIWMQSFLLNSAKKHIPSMLPIDATDEAQGLYVHVSVEAG